MPAYSVYVLANGLGQRYIGLSENVDLRLLQHNRGESRWTAGRGPWSLIWRSEAVSLTDARKLERLLKNQKGGAGFYRLTGLPRPLTGS